MRWRLAAPVMLLLALSLGALGLALGALLRPGQPGLPAQAPLIVLAAILLSWLAAALLATWQARSLLRPLGELARMARWLGQGDLDHRVTDARRGPFAPLAAALNAMGERLQQQVGALSAERDRLSAILASMADGVVIVDAAGTVVLLNPAAQRILRVPTGRGVGDSAVQVLRDHELAEALRAVLAGSGPARAPWLLQLGQPRRWVRAGVTPLSEAGGRQALLVLQDVTDLRRAELVRQEFVANVSHELRTPLATLKALVETLEGAALDDPPAARDFLGKMHVEVDGLAQLVSELLELARIESGQVQLQRQPVDAAQLAQGAAERLRPHAERAGLELRLDVSPGLPPVLADRARAEQALLNLLHNAIKFTPPGGAVSLSVAREEPGWLRFAVTDTGVGIVPEDLPRLFERFYKADRARAGSGTGLGLAIVKHAVQAHGGTVQVTSEPGQGSTFWFTLPLAHPAP